MNQTFTSSTAILVFAQSSKAEASHKAILKADDLFDVLTARTLATVEKTGLPYFHFTEKQQVGTTFGERFANAIQAVYDIGYERVITIGNDSPQLRAHHILEAEYQLHDNKLVLGPTTDGGFYLMGLNKNQFNTQNFQKLAWQTSEIAKQLLFSISATVEVFRLRTLFDIDTVADIKSFIAYAYQLPGSLLSILLLIVIESEKIVQKVIFSQDNLHFKLPLNKGSPLLIQAL